MKQNPMQAKIFAESGELGVAPHAASVRRKSGWLKVLLVCVSFMGVVCGGGVLFFKYVRRRLKKSMRFARRCRPFDLGVLLSELLVLDGHASPTRRPRDSLRSAAATVAGVGAAIVVVVVAIVAVVAAVGRPWRHDDMEKMFPAGEP